MYVPFLKQEESLKVECQHFLDCIHNGKTSVNLSWNTVAGRTWRVFTEAV